MVVGNGEDRKQQLRGGTQEGGIKAVQTGRGISPGVLRKLEFNMKENTKGINVLYKLSLKYQIILGKI
jgi:hypothetical protein